MEGLERGVAAAPRFSRSLMEWEIGKFAWTRTSPRGADHFQAARRDAGAPHEQLSRDSDGGRALERSGARGGAVRLPQGAGFNLVPEEDAMRVASLEVKMGRAKDAVATCCWRCG